MTDTTPGAPAVRSAKKEAAARLRDPLGLLQSLLDSGVEPGSCWPSASEGMRAVLHGNGSPPAPDSAEAVALEAAIGGPSVSAVRVHRSERSLQEAAETALCNIGWLFDPAGAIVIVANPEERTHWESLLARRWRKEFIPRGMDPAAVPAVLEIDRLGRMRWREAIVSPGCLALPGHQLADAVAAASLGLHTLAMPRR